MTITCNFASVATTISQLTISGVTVKDISAIPVSGNMITPVLFPNPHFISGMKTELQSLMGNPPGPVDFEYSLNYVYLHCPAGSAVSQLDVIQGLMTNYVAIVAAITNGTYNGKAEVSFGQAQDPGIIEDPAGNQFWGVLFSVKVKDIVQ